jgi:hypothetical protein
MNYSNKTTQTKSHAHLSSVRKPPIAEAQIEKIRNNLNRISEYMKDQKKEFTDIFFADYHKCNTFREKKEFHQKFQTEWKQLEDFLYSQIRRQVVS